MFSFCGYFPCLNSFERDPFFNVRRTTEAIDQGPPLLSALSGATKYPSRNTLFRHDTLQAPKLTRHHKSTLHLCALFDGLVSRGSAVSPSPLPSFPPLSTCQVCLVAPPSQPYLTEKTDRRAGVESSVGRWSPVMSATLCALVLAVCTLLGYRVGAATKPYFRV